MRALTGKSTTLPDGRVRIRANAVRGVLRIVATVGVVGTGVSVAVAVASGAGGDWARLVPNLLVTGATLWLLAKVWPARIEVGRDDVVVVNPFRTVRVERHRIAAVRASTVLLAVPLAFDLRDGTQVKLVGVSRWARRGLTPDPRWFAEAGIALDAWVRHGTRPPTPDAPGPVGPERPRPPHLGGA